MAINVDLSGKVAVITGGTGALGSAVTRRMHEAGALCHVTFIAEAERDRLLAEGWANSDRLCFHRVDVTDAKAVAGLFADVDSRHGRLDVLLAIAGGWGMAPVDEAPAQQWDDLADLNVKGVWLACREAVPRMKKRGWGRIVTVRPHEQRALAELHRYAREPPGDAEGRSLEMDLPDRRRGGHPLALER